MYFDRDSLRWFLSQLTSKTALREAVSDPRRAVSEVHRQVRGPPKDYVGEIVMEDEFERYQKELRESGLEERLSEKIRDEFSDIGGVSPRGYEYTPGTVSDVTATALYVLVRAMKPSCIVETGVCNGMSTGHILAALSRNSEGGLISIDYPERAETRDEAFEQIHKPGGAVIPPGKDSGWIVPDEFRDRWTLHEGLSQDVLEGVLETAKPEMFVHDSEHSYETMWYEFETVWPHLRSGGLLISDDVNSNEAFSEFADEVNRTPIAIDFSTKILRK